MNNVIASKIVSLQRCVLRAREEHHQAGNAFATDYTRQDAALLNVLRACEISIDLANHVINQRKLGMPSSTRESFELLEQAKIIDPSLENKMIRMGAFRNLCVHTYKQIDINIVSDVIQNGLNDLLKFADILARLPL